MATVNPNDAGSIKSAFPGYASWNDSASIVADYKATGGSGKGGSTSSSGGSSGSAPSVDPNAAFSSAKSLVGDVDTSSLSSAATAIQSDAAAKSQALKDAIPATQNIYSTLAKQLLDTFTTDKGTLEEGKTKDVAKQQTGAAASGLSTTQGFEAALTASIKKDYDTKIQTATDRYGVQATQLTAEEAKDIATLTSDAADALLAGDTAVANINAQIIDIKQKQTELISTAATAIMNAQNKNEADYYKSMYQSELLDMKQQSIDLAATKLQYTMSKGSGGGGVDITSPGVTGQTSSDGNWYFNGTNWIPVGE